MFKDLMGEDEVEGFVVEREMLAGSVDDLVTQP
jgi:hypothetical protein